MNGLVIKSPWMDRILETPSTWAIRGSRTNIRGRVALVRGRSGQIVGTCRIENCIGPMTLDELRAEADRQHVAVEVLSASPKAYAWVLSDVKSMAEPIPYSHSAGSAVWVKLTPENVPARYSELETEAPAAPQLQIMLPVQAAPVVTPPAPESQPEPAREEEMSAA